jgi:hypothetical protein
MLKIEHYICQECGEQVKPEDLGKHQHDIFKFSMGSMTEVDQLRAENLRLREALKKYRLGLKLFMMTTLAPGDVSGDRMYFEAKEIAKQAVLDGKGE